MLAEICNRCNTVEECYQFMLAYASQGATTDQGGRPGMRIRDFLERAVRALSGLAETCTREIMAEGLEPADKYLAFLVVVDRDVRDSVSAIEIVLAQPAISSQLIDNLNASVHLRTALTDLFLLGDIIRQHVVRGTRETVGASE